MYPGSTGSARFHDHASTRLQRPQWFKKNLQLSEKTITGQEYENRFSDTARNARSACYKNQGQPEKSFSHFDSPDLPMEFICMDLVGPIYPPSSKGNKYVLTVIDMLTAFTIAVPIKNKSAETICEAYRDNVLYFRWKQQDAHG